MFDFAKICKIYEQMSDAERRETLVRDSAVILPALRLLNGDGVTEFVVFAMTACSADGKLDPEEYRLFTDVTGISLDYADACELVKLTSTRANRNVVDIVVDTFGMLDEGLKANMISFCLCFCAANGKVDGKERRFIKRLIS